VHAHRVEVLDRADDTTLSAWSRITSSSYSFQPRIDSSSSTSVTGRVLQAGAGDPAQLGLVVGDARADAAHGERRPHDDRVAEFSAGRASTSSMVWQMTERADSAPQPRHHALELLAVLAALDRLDVGADQLDAVRSRTPLVQRHAPC
jgi:hypothetical protein